MQQGHQCHFVRGDVPQGKLIARHSGQKQQNSGGSVGPVSSDIPPKLRNHIIGAYLLFVRATTKLSQIHWCSRLRLHLGKKD